MTTQMMTLMIYDGNVDDVCVCVCVFSGGAGGVVGVVVFQEHPGTSRLSAGQTAGLSVLQLMLLLAPFLLV